MTIWKFPLQVADRQTVMMPGGAAILTAQMQSGQLCLWAQVEATQTKTPRVIRIFGTGHGIPDADNDYIGTVQMGPLVWHVFEEL
jgi:hypothetical protein